MSGVAVIPHAPRAHRLARDPLCDQLAVMNTAARRRPGRRVADYNACRLKDGNANLHYADSAVKNGYRWIKEKGKKLRPMTDAELFRKVESWTVAGFLTWRKPLKRKGRKTRWLMPATVGQRQAQARRRGVTIGWELKSRSYAILANAVSFVREVTRAGGKWFVMTLVNMVGWAGKLEAFKRAGAPTALLAHGQHKPANLAGEMQWIDTILGGWRR